MGITRPRNINPNFGKFRPIIRELDKDGLLARTVLARSARWRRRTAPTAPEPNRVSVPPLAGTKAKSGLGGGTSTIGMTQNIGQP